jgi:hypothetical protein
MGRRSEELPVLIAQSGPLHGQRWKLLSSLVIGREDICDIQIVDRQVSRQHARLSITEDGILLEDLGSKNGTHHNGERILAPVILQDNDSVQIALAQQFTYLSSDATLPLEDEFSELPSHTRTMLRLEKRSHRVWINNQEVLPPLSASQYKLLEILYDNPGKVVPRQTVIETVWGTGEFATISEQALDALVRRLRDRLAGIEPRIPFITTVRGHGLRLENPEGSLS